MKLFLDVAENVGNVLTEAAQNGEKKYYIEGIFAQAELKNRNGRIYPKKVLERAVEAYQPMIKDRRALGELNHPQARPNVDPERASHLIERLVWEGNNVMGRARILTSLPMGKIAKGLIDEGVKFGVSTRGMGSVTEARDAKIVGDDFVLNTVDLVSDPSGPECFVDGLMESRDWIFDIKTGSWVIAEQLQSEIKAMPARAVNEQKLQMFQRFLESIK